MTILKKKVSFLALILGAFLITPSLGHSSADEHDKGKDQAHQASVRSGERQSTEEERERLICEDMARRHHQGPTVIVIEVSMPMMGGPGEQALGMIEGMVASGLFRQEQLNHPPGFRAPCPRHVPGTRCTHQTSCPHTAIGGGIIDMEDLLRQFQRSTVTEPLPSQDVPPNPEDGSTMQTEEEIN